MPLVRIDYLSDGRPADFGARAGQVIYEALRSIGVPQDDRFQIITPHPTTGVVFDSNYLGVARTPAIVMIQITFNEGRTLDQKKALYKAIADGLHDAVQLRREDVFINLVEVKKENWSFGNGLAQYAP